jgi:hypothetical protein
VNPLRWPGYRRRVRPLSRSLRSPFLRRNQPYALAEHVVDRIAHEDVGSIRIRVVERDRVRCADQKQLLACGQARSEAGPCRRAGGRELGLRLRVAVACERPATGLRAGGRAYRVASATADQQRERGSVHARAAYSSRSEGSGRRHGSPSDPGRTGARRCQLPTQGPSQARESIAGGVERPDVMRDSSERHGEGTCQARHGLLQSSCSARALREPTWGPWSAPQQLLKGGDPNVSPPLAGTQLAPGGILRHPGCTGSNCAPTETAFNASTATSTRPTSSTSGRPRAPTVQPTSTGQCRAGTRCRPC